MLLKKTINILSGIVSISLMFAASMFLGLQIMENFFLYSQPQTTQAIASKTLPPAHPIDMVKNEALLAILSILVIFAGLLAYVFHQIIEKDLRGNIEKLAAEQRLAAKIEARYMGAYVLWVHHYASREDKGFLNEAIDLATQGMGDVEKLDRKKNEELICKYKNNLAFYLAVRNRTSDDDKTKAYALARYVYEVATGKNAKDYPLRYMWKATWALVLLRFYGYKEWQEREEGCAVIQELYKNSGELPPEERKVLDKLWCYIFAKKTFNKKAPDKKEAFGKLLQKLRRKDENKKQNQGVS